jgi:hypothetical protein
VTAFGPWSDLCFGRISGELKYVVVIHESRVPILGSNRIACEISGATIFSR